MNDNFGGARVKPMIAHNQQIAEVVVLSCRLLDIKMRQCAFDRCDHEGRCFELCKDKESCINDAVVYFHWSHLARFN